MATIEKNKKNLFDFGYKGKSLLDELMPVSDNNDRMCILRHNKLMYVYEKTRYSITCKKSAEGNWKKNKKKGLCEKWMLRIGERGGKAAVH